MFQRVLGTVTGDTFPNHNRNSYYRNPTRFPSRPLIIRVPFFLLFGFNKGTQKEKG